MPVEPKATVPFKTAHDVDTSSMRGHVSFEQPVAQAPRFDTDTSSMRGFASGMSPEAVQAVIAGKLVL